MKEYIEIDNGFVVSVEEIDKELENIDQIDIEQYEKDLRKIKLEVLGK